MTHSDKNSLQGGKSGAESIIVAHYKAVREESMTRLKQRDQVLLFFITGSTVVFGFYLKYPETWAILSIIPIFSVFTASRYVETDINVRILSIWLKQEYTKLLQEHCVAEGIGYSLRHWDSSEIEVGPIRGFASTLRYRTISFVLTLVSFGSCCVFVVSAWNALRDLEEAASTLMVVFFLGIFAVVFICCLVAPLLMIRRAHMHRRQTANITGEIKEERRK